MSNITLEEKAAVGFSLAWLTRFLKPSTTYDEIRQQVQGEPDPYIAIRGQFEVMVNRLRLPFERIDGKFGRGDITEIYITFCEEERMIRTVAFISETEESLQCLFPEENFSHDTSRLELAEIGGIALGFDWIHFNKNPAPTPPATPLYPIHSPAPIATPVPVSRVCSALISDPDAALLSFDQYSFKTEQTP